MIPEQVLIVVLGLLVGSFLNVCIWRIPRDLSIVTPPSSCPKCKSKIKPWDNVPVLSYLILGGKCRKCGEPISMRYPMIEALNAALYWLVLMRYGMGLHLIALLPFVSALVVITFIDLEFQIIPDGISIGGAVLGLVAGALILPDPFMRMDMLGWDGSLIGAVSGFTAFFLIAVASQGGMGGGDIKMMAMVGAVVGWKGVFLTTLAGSLMGSIVGLYLMAMHGKGRKTKVPFGPFLAAGALLSLLAGQDIFNFIYGPR